MLTQKESVLRQAGIQTARLDVLVLLEDVIGKDRAWLLAHPEHKLSPALLKAIDELLAKRTNREPLAYLRGKAEFYGREFVVTPDVLIPRPESEAMVELARELASTQDINTVIDVGTGSGCLAISIKKELPGVHVTGVDISPAALKVARENARKHQVQIQWRRMDILADGLPRMPKTRPYILVANLPYVPAGLVTSPEITKEPGLALFSGNDGLGHYQSFFDYVGKLSNKPFAIITESLSEQHTALVGLARDSGYTVAKTQDLAQLFVID